MHCTVLLAQFLCIIVSFIAGGMRSSGRRLLIAGRGAGARLSAGAAKSPVVAVTLAFQLPET